MSCVGCSEAFSQYGFTLSVGLRCYTSSIKKCCPKKVTILDFNNREVKYLNEDGSEEKKTFTEFMKSSWVNHNDF